MIKRLLNRLSSTRIILILFITILPQSIWAEDYNYGLTIAGNTVTSENANDILGDGGSVSFDQSTNTLTLTNVSYMSPDNFSTDFIVNGINTLTIFIIGENAVRCSSFITSDTGGEKTAVFATNTNNSGTLSIESTASNLYNNHTIDYQNGLCVKETGNNNDYHSTQYEIGIVDYNLTVGGVSVTSANATNITGANVSGSVSYAPSTNTLTLNGASINGNIVAEEDLVVCFVGENTMQKTTDDMLMFTGNGNNTLTFETNESNPGSLHIDGMTDKEYLTGNWRDCPKTTYDVADGSDEECDWWAKSNSSSLDIVYNKKYQIWLKGHQVTDATTFDSGVSYDREESILSYYGNYESYTIKSSLPTLTINIESGDYKMKAISFEPTEAVPNGTLTFNLSFGDQASLTLNNTDGEGGVINGFSQVILNNPLIVSSPDNFTEWTNSIKTATIGTATVYNIRIAGNVVSELNKNDVLGDGKVSVSVSNDGTGGQTYTLTLDNATITPEQEAPGIDYLGSSDLTIRLSGNNIIQGYGGCEAIRYNGVSQTNPYLYFVKDDNQHCSLELIAEVGKNEISGFHTNYDEHTFFVYSGEGNGANTYSTIYSTTIMGGTGSTNEPHIIASANDLKKFVEYYNDGRLLNNANVRLDANINCNGVTGFVQLADNTDATFRGVFDGNNKTISNLTLTGSGLFGYIEGGTVKDLTLSNYHLTGNSYPTGGIVAELSNGATISNCSITNSTIACAESQYNPEVGGIAARMSGSTITGCIIDNVKVRAETTYTGGSGASANAGGIVASASGGAISSCLVRNGSKITNFYADEGATLKGGAIVGSLDGTTLNQNKYDYDVIVEYGTNADNKIIKSGYTQRGVGGKYYDEDSKTYVDNPDIFENKGAVLYTKPVVLPAESPAGTVIGEESTYYYSENDGSILVAPNQTATIIAMPGDTYYTPVWLKAVNGETAITTDSTNIGDGGRKYSFTMPDAAVTVTAKFAIDLSTEGITTTIANASYTGEAIEPTTIAVDGITDVTSLTNGTDFTITGYTKSGEAVASPISVGTYTVSIEGKGNYTGIKDISFTINKGYAGLYFYRMDGAQESPVNTIQNATYGVAFDSPKLKNPHSLTFTLSCKAENDLSAAESDVATIDSEGTLTILKAGRVYVYATTEGNANYESQTEHYVLNIDKTSLNNVTIADIADKTFTGSAIEPAVTVTLNGVEVSHDDYSVSYINNINVSTDANKATITLTAKSTSEHFTEGTTKTARFNIVAKSITNDMIQAIADQTYSFGNAITPTVTVKDGETTLTLATTADDTGDYSIAYSNNTNAAKSTDETAPTVTITGKGNYTGTASKTFTINPMAVATATISLSDATLTYNGAAQHPTISSIEGENSEGSTLEFASSDYTVSYEQNDNTLTADDVKNAGGYTLVAIFGGNYSGTATTTFNIAAKDLSDAATIATIPDQTYTGNEIKPEPAVSIVLIDGNDATTLTKGTDFDYSYANNINASEQAELQPTVTITGKGNYTGSASQTFSITNATMTVTATGYNGTYDGNAHGITVVAPEGATVTYGTKKGTYDKTESPTYTDAGTYMVHYQVVKTNYTTITDLSLIHI